jgi:ornithine carbamoyltransferase
MGAKEQLEQKIAQLKAFQINKKLVDKAKSDVLILHCLPAERGREITDEVMNDPRTVVFDEAENRLHAQKAIIVQLLKNASL